MQPSAERQEVRLFLLLAGDTGVGKTTLAQRLARHARDANDALPDPGAPPPQPTIGVAYEHAMWTMGGTDIVLYMIDAAGNTQYAPLLPNQYRLAHGVLLLYDVTARESFEALEARWLPEVRRHAPADTVMALVGNKADLVAKAPFRRAVTSDEACALGLAADAVGVYECAARAWRLSHLVTPVEALLPAMVRCYHARRERAAETITLGGTRVASHGGAPGRDEAACCSGSGGGRGAHT